MVFEVKVLLRITFVAVASLCGVLIREARKGGDTILLQDYIGCRVSWVRVWWPEKQNHICTSRIQHINPRDYIPDSKGRFSMSFLLKPRTFLIPSSSILLVSSFLLSSFLLLLLPRWLPLRGTEPHSCFLLGWLNLCFQRAALVGQNSEASTVCLDDCLCSHLPGR